MRSLFDFDTEKDMMKRRHVCSNLQIQIEKHLCEKRGQLLTKVSKHQNIKIANNSSIKWGS